MTVKSDTLAYGPQGLVLTPILFRVWKSRYRSRKNAITLGRSKLLWFVRLLFRSIRWVSKI